MRSGCPAQCRRRDVEREADRVGEAPQYPRQVVAGAGARVDHEVAARFLRAVGKQVGQWRVVPGFQEPHPRRDHLAGVRRLGGDLGVQQVDVALPGDVERMPPVASQPVIAMPQPLATDGAAKGRHDRGR